MSISDRLAALGIESEAVREYDTWAEAPPAIYQSSVLMQDKADAAIESLLDEVERLDTELEAAIRWLTAMTQDYDENGDGIRDLRDVRNDVQRNISRLVARAERREG